MGEYVSVYDGTRWISIRGDQGDPGKSLAIKGVVADPSSLPAVGNVGDLWIVSSTGDGYAWDDATRTWSSVGRLQGPPGPQGIKGDRGSDGINGISATVRVGTVTTGVPGSSATVANTGTSSNAILDFKIPQGAEGPQGASSTVAVGTVTTGAAGSPAAVVNAGTASAAVLNFTIPAGAQGTKGDAGPAGAAGKDGVSPTVAIGTVTTGVPGSVANVTDSGTAPNHILNFVIPAGAAGAVGPAGKDAINPVFAIGTVTAATAPSVTIAGTAPNYTLSFALQKGDTGPAGKDGTGITIKGTANGGSWPPAGTHASGDLWIIGTPIPTGAPSGAAVGHGFIYDGTNWSDIGPIQGPQGPAGPSAVSTDAGNAARLGADSLIYVPTVTAPTASSTAPLSLAATAAVGTSGDYARADHVHPLPTAALVGAAPVTHTHTSAQVTGLATVATTGKYDDLLDKPTAYTLPTASAVTLGGVKIGTGITIDANGVISSSGGSGGSVSIATDTTAGIVKVGSGLSITPLGTLSVTFPTASTTQQGVVTLADAAAVTAGTAGSVIDAATFKTNLAKYVPLTGGVMTGQLTTPTLITTSGTQLSGNWYPQDKGTAGQFLSTNGFGILSWSNPATSLSATDRLLGRSSPGGGLAEEIPCTPYIRTLLDDADAATARATLSVQPTNNPAHTGAATFTNVANEVPVTVNNTGTGSSLVVSKGRVLFGTSNVPLNANTVSPSVVVSGNGVNGSVQIVRHTSVGSSGGLLILSSTRGTDVNSHGILQNNDGIGAVNFHGSDGSSFVAGANINALVEGSPGTGHIPAKLVFGTASAGDSNPTTRLTISSTGTATFTGQVLVTAGSGTAGSYKPGVAISGDDNTGVQQVGGADTLSLVTGGAERVRVDASGRVGVGITPTAQLHVAAPGSAELAVRSTDVSTWKSRISFGNAIPKYEIGVDVNSAGDNNFYFYDLAATTTRLIIDASGKVGIGVAPGGAGSTLQVRGDVSIFPADRSTTQNFGVGDDGIVGWHRAKIAFIPSGDVHNVSQHIAFFNKDGDNSADPLVERMRIAANGDVGIGTTANRSGVKLDVRGTGLFYHIPTDGLVTVQGMQKESGGTGKSAVQIDVNGKGGFAWQCDTTSGRIFRLLVNSGYGGSDNTLMTVSDSGHIGFTQGSGGANTFRPGLAVLNDDNTGIMQQAGADTLTFVTAGREAITIDATQQVKYKYKILAGQEQSVGTPMYAFDGDPDTGIGRVGQDILTLITAGQQRAQVSAAGNVCIGTASDNGNKLQVNGQIWATSGTIATSDAKFKENVQPLADATSVVERLRPVAFDFIPQPDREFSTDRQVGLIAQETQAALAGTDYADSVVSQCGDHLGLAYEKLVPVLIRALQESNARIAALEEKLRHV